MPNKKDGTPDIDISGSVSGANIVIGASQEVNGDVSINYNALSSTRDDSVHNELKALLQELEAALKQVPATQREDVELVQQYANDIAEEASKDKPHKRKLTITGDSLKKAAENLASVAPIAVKIAKVLLMME